MGTPSMAANFTNVDIPENNNVKPKTRNAILSGDLTGSPMRLFTFFVQQDYICLTMSILKIEETDPIKIHKKWLSVYARFLESMTVDSKALSATLLAKDVHYQSPLYSVFGRDEVLSMFAQRLNVGTDYKFKVREQLWGEGEQTGFLRWDMMSGGDVIVGMSEILFDFKGLVAAQTDFFDPLPAMMKKPLTGYMIKRHLMIKE